MLQYEGEFQTNENKIYTKKEMHDTGFFQSSQVRSRPDLRTSLLTKKP